MCLKCSLFWNWIFFAHLTPPPFFLKRNKSCWFNPLYCHTGWSTLSKVFWGLLCGLREWVWVIWNLLWIFTAEWVLLLLLLSHFSHVRLCVTPWTAAHQAPPSLGFSRQEHWSGLPFPSPMYESEKVKVKSLSRVRLLATPWTTAYQPPLPMGFFQARVLEWSAIAVSKSFH